MTYTDFTDPWGSTWRQDLVTGVWNRWDGTQWVTTGRVPVGLGPPPPPPYVAPPRRRPVWPWVVGGVGLALVLTVALVVVAIDTAVHQLNKIEAAHAISQSQFNAVQLGTSQQAVERELGKPPETTSDFISKGALHSTQVQQSCIYYNRTGHIFGDGYQFCFTDGSLTIKRSF